VKKMKINNLQKAPAVNVLARLQLPGGILCVHVRGSSDVTVHRAYLSHATLCLARNGRPGYKLAATSDWRATAHMALTCIQRRKVWSYRQY
jgi:hypothetical protein